MNGEFFPISFIDSGSYFCLFAGRKGSDLELDLFQGKSSVSEFVKSFL